MTTPSRLIALDADGVLLNYHSGYQTAWERAFGTLPEIADANAYWPQARFGVPQLDKEGRDRLRAEMGTHFWASLPPLEGALEACRKLSDAGYDLICVSAVKDQYRDARAENLADIGFPLSDVIAAPSKGTHGHSPKAAALEALKPIAFVDDYAPYLRGVDPQIHKALILREPNGSPNTGTALELSDSTHRDLADFANWWLRETA